MEVFSWWHWLVAGISAFGTLFTIGAAYLYKWKVDRMWIDYSIKHRINGWADRAEGEED